ncbi:MAG TPA: pitrilysin family protein [Pyrinomonadaceae bacterium]|jgi:zinc protease|nr:pitrilysin family protein [Pyrinomonadaceae bacterium]
MKNRLIKFRLAALPSALLLFSVLSLPGVARAQNAPVPQETPPPPAAPRPVSVPKPSERTLRNGLRVIVIEHHEMPLVAAQLLVKNGGEVDPADLSGIANMTADLLTKGTKTRTAPQIAQEIEALGGQINSAAGWDASRANVNVIASKTEPALAILADVVRNPVFKDEEIERLRQQYLDSLSVGMNNPGTLASYVAARVVFGDTPYGHLISGTPESLPRIKREDIVALHERFYRPDNAVLVIGGDIKAADAFRLAEKLFGDWARPSTPLPVAPTKTTAAQARGGQRVLVVDMPGAGQAAVLFARRGIARTDPEYYAGIVANSVLTGYSGRLNEEIRIKRGLSYGAGSSLQVRRDVGPFVASAQTKNQTGAEVASLLLTELTRLSSEPVAEAELTPRKATLIGGFGRSLETTDGLVGQVASLALYGLDLGEINRYITSVQAVTSAQLQQFAGSRLGVKDADIVIVGDAKDFIEPLRKQFPNVEVIKRDELDLNSATLRKGAGGAATK